ncbi:hypothetical protein [Salana multivorans]
MAKDWSREWRSTGTRSLVRPVLAVVGLGVVGLAPLVAVARGALPSWLTVPAAILAFAASTVLLVAVVMLCQSARLAGLLRGVRRAEPGALLAGARVDRDRLRRATGLDGELLERLDRGDGDVGRPRPVARGAPGRPTRLDVPRPVVRRRAARRRLRPRGR